MCDRNEIEDEIHFMLNCTLYDEIRNRLLLSNVVNIINNFDELSNEDKFIFIMKLNYKIYYKYLDEAWRKRRNVLFK